MTRSNSKFCPNCGAKNLPENKKLAQGVVECLSCDSRFYILITSVDNNRPKCTNREKGLPTTLCDVRQCKNCKN